MEIRRVPRRTFDLATLALRSFQFAALVVVFVVSFTGPLMLAAAEPSRLPAPRQTSQDSEANSESGSDSEVETAADRRIQRRLLTVALAGGVLLLLLAYGYGYLRLELTTRGFYSGRLQIAAAIASISTVTGAYFLWRWLIN